MLGVSNFIKSGMLLNVALSSTVFLAGPVSADTLKVGQVDRVQEQVVASQNGNRRELENAAPLFFRDKLASGVGARLEAKLNDGTTLTLGERGRLMIDDFVYDPNKQGGRLDLTVTSGAFLFVGGKVEGPTGGNVKINTPVGTLAVRGTTVWGGPIDGAYGVLVLSGQVDVKTKHGLVALHAGEGTMIYAKSPPMAAHAWPEGRTKRAVSTITFGEVDPPPRYPAGHITKP